MSKAIANSLREFILRNGGATISLANGQPYESATGYAVGLVNETLIRIPVAEATDRLLDGIVGNIGDIASDFGANFVGFWVDNGVIHADPVRVVQTKSEAVALGKAKQQLAIWDFRRKSEIRLGA